MYRRLLINIHQVRNGLIHTQNTRLPSTKCKENEGFAPAVWVTGLTSHRPFGTSSIFFGENKEGSASPPDDKEKISEQNEAKTEVITDGQGNTEINKVTNISNTTLTSQVVTEPEVTPENSKSTESTKTGKENLLDILREMKVDVTTVRKARLPKVPRIPEKPTPEQMESTQSMFQDAMAEKGSEIRKSLNPELVTAASAAASMLPNSQKAESELLRQLRKLKAEPDTERADKQNIGDIIADMKIGKMPNGRHSRPFNQIHFDDDGQGYTQDRSITSELGVRKWKSPFTSKRLNIFTPGMEQDSSEMGPTLWDIDLVSQIVKSTNQMPRNGFEEMIQWTKEGKLWEYPINNEAGMDEEASVPFHEHVFLEKHLESFPQKGPIRHFMELVIIGLSKNHHLTVQQKKDHISWFKDYFQQKDEVLKEAEAFS